MTLIPVISHADPGAVVACRGARVFTAAGFLGDVTRVAQMLPPRRFLVNFCNDRYRFAVGLVAALLRDQVSLLPPSQTPEMLGQLQKDYGQLYALTDAPLVGLPDRADRLAGRRRRGRRSAACRSAGHTGRTHRGDRLYLGFHRRADSAPQKLGRLVARRSRRSPAVRPARRRALHALSQRCRHSTCTAWSLPC